MGLDLVILIALVIDITIQILEAIKTPLSTFL